MPRERRSRRGNRIADQQRRTAASRGISSSISQTGSGANAAVDAAAAAARSSAVAAATSGIAARRVAQPQPGVLRAARAAAEAAAEAAAAARRQAAARRNPPAPPSISRQLHRIWDGIDDRGYDSGDPDLYGDDSDDESPYFGIEAPGPNYSDDEEEEEEEEEEDAEPAGIFRGPSLGMLSMMAVMGGMRGPGSLPPQLRFMLPGMGGPGGMGMAASHLAAALRASMEAAEGHPGPQNGVQSGLRAHLKETAMTKADCEHCGECAVCFDDFKEGDLAVRMPCDHWYHKKCIDPWLDKSDTCPTCRAPVDLKSLRNAGLMPGFSRGGIVDLTLDDTEAGSGAGSQASSSSSSSSSSSGSMGGRAGGGAQMGGVVAERPGVVIDLVSSSEDEGEEEVRGRGRGRSGGGRR